MSGLAEIEKRLTSCAVYLRSGKIDQRAAVLETVDELLDQRNKLVGVPRIVPTSNLFCSACKHAHPARHMPSLVLDGGTVTHPIYYLICPCCDRVRS